MSILSFSSCSFVLVYCTGRCSVLLQRSDDIVSPLLPTFMHSLLTILFLSLFMSDVMLLSAATGVESVFCSQRESGQAVIIELH